MICGESIGKPGAVGVDVHVGRADDRLVLGPPFGQVVDQACDRDLGLVVVRVAVAREGPPGRPQAAASFFARATVARQSGAVRSFTRSPSTPSYPVTARTPLAPSVENNGWRGDELVDHRHEVVVGEVDARVVVFFDLDIAVPVERELPSEAARVLS